MKWEEAVAWLVAQPDQEALVRASYFDLPVRAAAERYWRSPEWSEVRTWLPIPQGNALDVGAGNGIVTFALAQEGWTVTALEPDPSTTVGAGAIEALMASQPRPTTIFRDFGEAIPIPSGSMDLVIARQVLHHAHDLAQFCSELARVLKPGGTLITLRDHVISSKTDLPSFLERHPLHSRYGGECAYRTRDYTRALSRAGFTIKRVIRPFDSIVNYAPRTRVELRTELQQRLSRLPLGQFSAKLLSSDFIFGVSLRVLSHADWRPGRLYSFLCSRSA